MNERPQSRFANLRALTSPGSVPAKSQRSSPRIMTNARKGATRKAKAKPLSPADAVRQEERSRAKAVFSLPETRGREMAAVWALTATNMAPAAIERMLTRLPLGEATQTDFRRMIREDAAPARGTTAKAENHGWAEAHRKAATAKAHRLNSNHNWAEAHARARASA